jgi:tetratricopeptide (TPR) repeat protein
MPGRCQRLGSLGKQTSVLAAAVLLLGGGCALKDWRFETHRERAAGYIEAGQLDVALIELYSALGIRSDHPDVNFQIAELESQRLDAAAARFFYDEAVRHDPSNIEAAVKLAMLIVAEEPDRSRYLIEEALEKDPESPWTSIGLSDLALVSGDTFWALEAANEAVRSNPGFARAHWQLARVRLAMLRERSLQRRRIPESMIDDAQQALEAYAKLAPGDPARTALEYGRVMAFSKERWEEAAQWFGLALAMARESTSREVEAYTAREALSFGRESGNQIVRRAALRTLTRIEPEGLDAWQELAEVSAQGRAAVFRDLLAARPDDAAARIMVAREELDEKGLAWATSFLHAEAEAGVDPPVLLGFVADLQLHAGLESEWEQTSRRLVEEYPQHPRAILARAHLELARPDPDSTPQEAAETASGLLYRLIELEESGQALRLLAIAESRLQRHRLALRSIERAIDLSSRSLELDRIQAKILHDAGYWQVALNLWRRIRTQDPLTNAEELMLARCAYRTGKQSLGRRTIMKLLAQEDPPVGAAIELAEHEAPDPLLVPKIMRALEAEIERGTRDQNVLALATAIDLEAGRRERALSRLVRQLDREIATRLRLQEAARGAKQARAVARTERQRQHISGLVRYVATLQLEADEVDTLIAVLRAARSAGMFNGRSHIWLARLQQRIGRERAARASYERALAAGVEDAWVKNELALLLARNGVQLERALHLALETVELVGHADARDTLGYVYLRSGDSEAALEQFRRALELSETDPQAEFHYHLGLALAEQGQNERAAMAFQEALNLDPDLPGAADALAKIESHARAASPREPS